MGKNGSFHRKPEARAVVVLQISRLARLRLAAKRTLQSGRGRPRMGRTSARAQRNGIA
jgi:hypothetical protein